MPRVYDELRQIAAAFFRGQSRDQTLQPTAVVHEAYLRLFGWDAEPTWQNRAHFFGTATRAMRQLLVERARRHGRGERHRGVRVTLEPGRNDVEARGCDSTVLVESLDRLEAEDPRSAEVVMLRFFGGVAVEDIARLLDLSLATVKRDLAFGKARLYDAIMSERG